MGWIRALPIKGGRKGWAQIETMAASWGWSDGRGHNRNGTPLPVAFLKQRRGYFRREGDRYWVSAYNLNEPGDTAYHGPKLTELVAERQEAKDTQQAKAARKMKGKTKASVRPSRPAAL